MERELAGARTRLSSLTEFLSDAAPSVRILQSQIEAMEAELAEQRSRLGTGQTQSDTTGSAVAGGTFTDRVAIYEDLAVDMEFLQQAYLTALAAREAARLEADRQQRYLAAFVRPSLPERALYPQRTQSILIFAGDLHLWSGLIGRECSIYNLCAKHSSLACPMEQLVCSGGEVALNL